MRSLVRGAIEGARDQMMDVTRAIITDRSLSDEEMVRRYVERHRGNPDALIAFARRNAPAGSNPITEAVRYEQAMERLIKAHGG
jgi:hypothetical protein